MEVSVVPDPGLAAGAAALPEGMDGSGGAALELGCATAEVQLAGTGAPGRLCLAPDVCRRLWVPYNGIRLHLRRTATDQLELGPAVAVLWPGRKGRLSAREAARRASLYYGHVQGTPGLLAMGFDESIDWDSGSMEGYVLDNRAGGKGLLLPARFPIPAALYLTWSIRRDVIQELRERTGNRAFNWVRSIGKWQFYSLLSGVPHLARHLPETRLLRASADLAALLARHDVVFVKHVHSIKGQGVARIRRLPEGFEVRHMDRGRLAEVHFAHLTEVMAHVRGVTGPGRTIVQQGIPVAGQDGRALDFRFVIVRNLDGDWRCAAATANVAPDDRVVFCNLANGATDEDLMESLRVHFGMSTARARDCAGRMEGLCLAAARVLAVPFHPLGILGFDVAVDASDHHLWLLEANSVPGWGYPLPVEEDLARSLVSFALHLAGHPGAGAHA